MALRISKQRGTSLAELLVAIIFIASCAGAILGSVSGSVQRSGYAKRRSLALSQAKSTIETLRSTGRTTALAPGTQVTAVTIPGFGGPVAQTRVISAIAGHTNLFRVNVRIAWADRGGGGSRSDDLTLETILRCPDY